MVLSFTNDRSDLALISSLTAHSQNLVAILKIDFDNIYHVTETSVSKSPAAKYFVVTVILCLPLGLT